MRKQQQTGGTETGQDWKEFLAEKKGTTSKMIESYGILLKKYCDDNELSFGIIQPWQLRIGNGKDTLIDIFPKNRLYHNITSSTRGKFRDVIPFLNSVFGINQQPKPYIPGLITFEKWSQTYLTADLCVNEEPEVYVGDNKMHRFLLGTNPDDNNLFIFDTSNNIYHTGRVILYNKTQDLIDDSKKGFAVDGVFLINGGVQVPGFKIVIYPLVFNVLAAYKPQDTGYIEEMARWYGARVALPQVDGRFKRYKL